MCLGIPGQIVALFPGQNDLATVNISGVKRDINIALLENEMVKPGDWVLIHCRLCHGEDGGRRNEGVARLP